MTNKEEALRMALEALEDVDGIDTETECVTIDVGEVITAIREVLEQPEHDEALLRQAFDAIVNVLSGADYDDPYASLKEAAKALSDRLGGGLK